MRHFAIILLLQITLSGFLFAQEGTLNENGIEKYRKNTIYLEILGNGAVYSINYDRMFTLKNHKALIMRIGGNEYHGAHTEKMSYNFIGAAGLLHGGPKHFMESGIGYTYFSGSADRLVVFLLGYRYQGKNGFSFRAVPMYIYNSEKGDTFGNNLWFGVSFGYSL